MQGLAMDGRFGVAAAIRRRLAWPHPEWWALALSAAAWLVIVATALFTAASGDSHHASLSHSINLTTSLKNWLLMTVAMMFPLSIGAIQATAHRSLWRRRHRAIAGWLVGYLAVWLLVGVTLWLISTLLLTRPMLASRSVVAIAFLLAASWQVAPTRARALARCHHTQPIAPAGWRADYDCVRYGWTMGVWCSMTCGALMVACWLVGHGPPGVIAMAFATLIGFTERYVARPDPRWLAASIVVMAMIVVSVSW
jgi:predicted metal-binding membrane protein